jgi:hypothetical protein
MLAPYIRVMSGDILKLPADLRNSLQRELQAGEQILYAGQPDWRAEWGKLLAILLFGLFWSAISFMFFGMSLGGLLGLIPVKSDGAPAGMGLLTFTLLFSLPFVAIGSVMMATPFLAIRKSRNTVHAVTDTRLLNVFVGKDQGAESYPLAKVNFIKRNDHSGSQGNLSIGYGVEKDSDGDPQPLTMDWSGIPDVRRAEAAIREELKRQR